MRTRLQRGSLPTLLTLVFTAAGASDALADAGACRLLAERAAAFSPQALRQTSYVPYYMKNRIKYDNFKWHIYTTDHFEIFYYPETEQHLERVTSYAESAYQQISSDLKHDLGHKVPMILFKTASEFQQQNIMPGEVPEGVLAFAEAYRDRMVLPIDEPPDQLYRLITHELTHIFEFDIIPRSLLRRGLPAWVDEGLANYMAAYWNPFDLMQVRDAAITDNIPKMSEFEASYEAGRVIYAMGHAAFEFIESKWGKEGLRQFMFALRKAVIGGGESAYEEAFRIKPEEFDEQFDKFMKDRFKPFRDKERPNDYGRNLAPKRDKTPFVAVISIEPSPSGDLMAVAAANRKEQELDIILLSTKDGKVIRNLTGGFNKDQGFEYIASPGGFRSNAVPWMSWAPAGDRIAYFARTEKQKTLILQNVVTKKIERRIELKDVDAPESPDISPDGREVAFAAIKGGVHDLFAVNIETEELRNLTKDDFGDYAPTYAPDGKSIIYIARVSSNDKLFRLDLASLQKTQVTFGTHDDGAAQFLDADTIVFPSTATDPNQAIDAEVARNGNIYNIWTLNLKNGELKQFTDTLTANVSPIVLKDQAKTRIAFVSYYKGEFGIHTLTREQPVTTVASADFGTPGPIIDFQPPMTHTLVRSNIRRKGTFEKMFLEGRPPVNLGVTSGGDLFGGTQVTFSDVLGDKQFNMFAASVQQYRTMSFSYVNLSRRLQYALQAFSQTQFFYGIQPGIFYDYELAYLDRDQAIATQTARGMTAFAIYPFNRYARMELTAGALQFKQAYNEQSLQDVADQFQQEQFGRVLFSSGSFMPLGIAYVQETTVFREYGPLAGNTVRLGYEYAPKVGKTMLSRQAIDGDARYYMRLATNGVLAFRARGYKSWGEYPGYIYFGGNSEMRGYEYLEFLGNKGFFANAELRFPLIEAALTPIGVVGGLRGILFVNVGAAGFDGQAMNVFSKGTDIITPLVGFTPDLSSISGFRPVFAPTQAIGGFKLIDGRGSYGVGLETFALGFPIHFDWSWRTLFNREWENAVFALQGNNAGMSGSEWFRKPRFAMWIGYDF
jgi:hypothetical protein